MFIDFFSFRRQFGAPEIFFPGAQACAWNCTAPLLSCGASLVMLTFLFFFSFLPACMAPLSSCWLFFNVSPFKLDLSHMFCPAWGCVMGRHIYFFSHFQDDIMSSFFLFPTRWHCWGVMEYRRNVKNHNSSGVSHSGVSSSRGVSHSGVSWSQFHPKMDFRNM